MPMPGVVEGNPGDDDPKPVHDDRRAAGRETIFPKERPGLRGVGSHGDSAVACTVAVGATDCNDAIVGGSDRRKYVPREINPIFPEEIASVASRGGRSDEQGQASEHGHDYTSEHVPSLFRPYRRWIAWLYWNKTTCNEASLNGLLRHRLLDTGENGEGSHRATIGKSIRR